MSVLLIVMSAMFIFTFFFVTMVNLHSLSLLKSEGICNGNWKGTFRTYYNAFKISRKLQGGSVSC